MGYRDYSTAKGHIVDATGHGDFTTIASALSAASSGQTIFIRPGTYTENLTLKAGVNLVAYTGDANTPNVTIIGNATLSAAGTVSISGIRLQTNSAAFLTVSGSAASIVNLLDCYLNCTNNTGISFTSSSASALIQILNCNGDIGTTGISLYAATSPGFIIIKYTRMTNSGSSVTASTASTTNIDINSCVLSMVLSTASTGSMNAMSIQIVSINTTSFTLDGTGASQVENCTISSGTASAISIGAGASANINNNRITSTNANALTGAGTLISGNNIFTSSATANTTTQTPNSFGPTNKNSNQPAFLVNLASTDADVTGNNTLYTVGTNTAYTEIFDQAGNFSGTTFTAPVPGRYYFSATTTFTGITAATSFELAIVTSNRSYFTQISGIVSPATGNYSLTRSVLADMDAADTATMQVRVNGQGADTVDLLGSSANFTNFSGFLAC